MPPQRYSGHTHWGCSYSESTLLSIWESQWKQVLRFKLKADSNYGKNSRNLSFHPAFFFKADTIKFQDNQTKKLDAKHTKIIETWNWLMIIYIHLILDQFFIRFEKIFQVTNWLLFIGLLSYVKRNWHVIKVMIYKTWFPANTVPTIKMLFYIISHFLQKYYFECSKLSLVYHHTQKGISNSNRRRGISYVKPLHVKIDLQYIAREYRLNVT